ncbi:hypothetical protein L211DRAFT_839549 [Terfezia boudieri ATCC MYA-4762]|uniref:Uncharacterized protein n=1 Tax=Terfezia boudieri ATCC MYA-4762 TaxID=1051890 RepID=A0A3N4LHX7_9PEZI|nr:hypothetical protein L211DRAFT_839549 [Terfezia boudieri ATCC MYA-4762]
MTERKKTIVTFSPAGYEKHRETVLEIIKNDTGTDAFVMTKSFPPIYHPPPLTQCAITELTELRPLGSVNVKVVEE